MIKHIPALLILCALLATQITAPAASWAQTAPAPCQNLLANGSMQDDTGWRLDGGPIPPRYVKGGHTDDGALLIGPDNDPAKKGERWSSAIQRVRLPARSQPQLSFWYQFRRGSDQDLLQVAVLDDNGEVLSFLLTDLAPTKNWQEYKVDLSKYAGQTVKLFFAVSSDGATGQMQLLLDDVSLCDTTIATAPAPGATAGPATAPAPGATAGPATAPAPGATPAPSAPGPVLDTAISLASLGLNDITLRGPFDGAGADLLLPAGWQPTGNASLQLDLRTVLNGKDNLPTTFDGRAGATLRASLNGVDLGSIALSKLGQQGAVLPVPDNAVAAVGADGRHHLQFSYDGGDQCVATQPLDVIIGASSALVLPRTDGAPPLSLAALPRPIYQGPLAPNNTLIVVPDKPSAAELQAAFVAAAGLGRMTDGKLKLALLPAGQLSESLRAANNLIVIGKAASIGAVGDLKLPAAEGAVADDGRIQIGISPWSSTHTVLLLSGDSDAAVLKAGQAVSGGAIRVGARKDMALVSMINPVTQSANVGFDRTLADLGFRERMISGAGPQETSYRFDLPTGQAVSGGAYLDLSLNHSNLLSAQLSSAVALLNGQPIGSLSLGPETAALSTVRLNIPRSALRLGTNVLTIAADLRPQDGCVGNNPANMWMMIWPESTMHVALEPRDDINPLKVDLGQYPYPFVTNSDLGGLALVVAQNDPAGWDVAAQLAFSIGTQSGGGLVSLTAAYGDALDEAFRSSHDLLIVGRPSLLPVIGELKDVLPVPFVPGQDQLIEQNTQVAYRHLAGEDVAYLEAIGSPWSTEHVLFGVLPPTDAALRQAGAALIDPAMRAQLSGHVALVSGAQVIADPEAQMNGAAGSGGAVLGSAPLTDALSASRTVSRPRWIIPVIIGSLLVMLGVVGYLALNALRRRRSAS